MHWNYKHCQHETYDFFSFRRVRLQSKQGSQSQSRLSQVSQGSESSQSRLRVKPKFGQSSQSRLRVKPTKISQNWSVQNEEISQIGQSSQSSPRRTDFFPQRSTVCFIVRAKKLTFIFVLISSHLVRKKENPDIEVFQREFAH